MEKKLLSAKRRTRRSSHKKRTPAKSRRRYTRRKKGMLSEMFSGAVATHSAQNVLFGALGGALGYGLIQAMKNTTLSPIVKTLILGGGSFLMGSLAKAPMIAGGMAGVGALTLISAEGRQISGMTPVPISEPAYLSEIDLDQLPAVLEEGYLEADYLGASYLSAPYM